MKQESLSAKLIKLTCQSFPTKEITPAPYARMKYPKLIPLMRFSVRQFRVDGFGHLMAMDTRAMGGLMKLSTVVFTPGEGGSVPFLLIDTMQMKKKSLAFAEFYDCTKGGASASDFESLPADYSALPNYTEKPAWYIERRAPYSLIKGGAGVPSAALEDMVLQCAALYLHRAAEAEKSEENKAGLKVFQEEMCSLGNPSTGTLEKLFGQEGAKQFFKTVIMPVGK